MSVWISFGRHMNESYPQVSWITFFLESVACLHFYEFSSCFTIATFFCINLQPLFTHQTSRKDRPIINQNYSPCPISGNTASRCDEISSRDICKTETKLIVKVGCAREMTWAIGGKSKFMFGWTMQLFWRRRDILGDLAIPAILECNWPWLA